MRQGVVIIAFAIAAATVITALTLRDRQTAPVIDAVARGGSMLIESSLGQRGLR